MIKCSECGALNRDGIFFCEECGKKLDLSRRDVVDAPPPPLQPITSQEAPAPKVAVPPAASAPTLEPEASITWGTSHLSDKSTIQFRFMHTSRSLRIAPKEKLIIGRVDHGNPSQPDVDLVPYGALENGVSRLHASLEMRNDTLLICDLGSSNGTYVNNLRLPPHQPHLLRDGDEVRFGRLVAHLHFN